MFGRIAGIIYTIGSLILSVFKKKGSVPSWIEELLALLGELIPLLKQSGDQRGVAAAQAIEELVRRNVK